MELMFIIVVVLLVVALLPHWPYSTGWGYGYYPSGVLFVVLIVLLVLLLMGGGIGRLHL